jgi:hypothetical protein
MAAEEPAGEAVHELMKPQVRRSNHGSQCLVHDAVYDEMSSTSRPTSKCVPVRRRPGYAADPVQADLLNRPRVPLRHDPQLGRN